MCYAILFVRLFPSAVSHSLWRQFERYLRTLNSITQFSLCVLFFTTADLIFFTEKIKPQHSFTLFPHKKALKSQTAFIMFLPLLKASLLPVLWDRPPLAASLIPTPIYVFSLAFLLSPPRSNSAALVSPVSETRTQNLPLTLWSPLVISYIPLSQKTPQISHSLISLTFYWEFNPSQGRFCIHHLIETASRSLSPVDTFQGLWVWCLGSSLPLAGHSSGNSFLLTFVNSHTLSFSLSCCHSIFMLFACFFCVITTLKCCFVSKLWIGHLLTNIPAKWSHSSSKF